MVSWLLFAACTGVIVYAGTKLSVYGDALADRTGLGRTWIGVVLMASVTSLPELITGVSSVLVFEVPDIAAGDVIGSCMFNLLILSFLDIRNPVPLSARIHQGHVLSAAFGILLIGQVALALLAGPVAPVVGWFGLHSLGFLAIYLLAMRTIFIHERSRMAMVAAVQEMAGEMQPKGLTLRRAATLYALNAAILIAAATLLPGLGERLAEQTGLGQTVVGSLLVALSTSLPEVVVSASAARLGAVDMAAGNLFGSNLFNVAILAVDDLLYVPGSLLAAVSPSHAITAVAAMTMAGVAVIGMTFRAGRKRYGFSWDGVGIAAIYLLASLLLLGARP